MSPPGKMLSGTSRGSAQKLKPLEVCIHHGAVLWLLAAWNQICIFIFAIFAFLINHHMQITMPVFWSEWVISWYVIVRDGWKWAVLPCHCFELISWLSPPWHLLTAAYESCWGHIVITLFLLQKSSGEKSNQPLIKCKYIWFSLDAFCLKHLLFNSYNRRSLCLLWLPSLFNNCAYIVFLSFAV